LGGNVGIVNNGQNLTVTLPRDITVPPPLFSGAAQGNLATLSGQFAAPVPELHRQH
jgi:hypothetical protein